MKCKNCGATITMTQKFCDNCGSPNEQYKDHVDAMNRYGKEFNKTKKQVEMSSRWFFDFLAPATVLIIAMLSYMFFMYADNSLLSYHIADANTDSYISKHREEINAHLQELLDQGEYYKLYQAKMEGRQLQTGDERYGWNMLYNCAYDYSNVREAMTVYFDPVLDKSYRRDSALSDAAKNVYAFYDDQKHSSSVALESKVYFADLQGQFETFLKVYCYLTDEDIAGLSKMDQTSILTLITRRVADEEAKTQK